MYNDLFTIGPFTVHMYGLMTAIGIISAYLLMEHFAKKKGLDPDRIFWLLIWCLIFGYIGSKILYFITILPQIAADPSLMKRSLTDGWVMYGGLLGGILGGFLYCRLKKLNAWAYFDIGLTAVVLAQAFGRIGCFFAGCCYGVETSCSFSIMFRNSQFAPNNVALIPTQLIMSAGDFILFIFLLFYDKKKKNEGQVTGAYLTLYSLGRFIIEFFRGDIERGAIGPLSTSQFIAVFMIIIGLVIWIRRTKSSDGLFMPAAAKEATDESQDTEKTEDKDKKEENAEADEKDAAKVISDTSDSDSTDEPEDIPEEDVEISDDKDSNEIKGPDNSDRNT